MLCAILFRCQALVDELSSSGGPSLKEAIRLRDMLGQTAEEVERISRNLRPGVLDQLGLEAVLRAAGSEFAEKTGLPVRVRCVELAVRLPANTELALYRILQEALKNVAQHARAKHVTVDLTQVGEIAQLTITDDGISFDTQKPTSMKKENRALGLLGMRERATYVGGTLAIKSSPHGGTEIEVRVPIIPGALAAA